MKPSFVYFARPVGQEGPVKIGCSEFPIERVQTLMTWAPIPLELVATIPGDLKLERRIHGIFAERHSHREWFHTSPRLTALIADLAAGRPLGELLDLSAPLLPFRQRVGVTRAELSDDRRRYLSYSSRLRHAFKYSEALGHGYAPADVAAIISRWDHATTKSRRWNFWGAPKTAAQLPSAADLARLDEVLSNPASHRQTQEQRFPKPRAVA